MVMKFGKLCKFFEKEGDLFFLIEKVCIKYNIKMFIKEMLKNVFFLNSYLFVYFLLFL